MNSSKLTAQCLTSGGAAMFSFLFNFSKSLEIYENVKKIRYFAKNKVCSDSLNCFCVCDFFLSVQGQIPVFTGGGIRVQRPERALNLSSEKLGRWRKKKGFIFSWSCTGGRDGSLAHKHASKIRQRG